MYITVKTWYDIQYLTVCLSGYMNAPTERAFLSLRHGMEYHMHHPHEPIMYSRKNILKLNESPRQLLFKVGSAESSKIQEESNFIHTYCDTYHARDISDRRSFTLTYHLWNVTFINWCDKKQLETYQISNNAETRSTYKGVLYNNYI